jgi:hypothetical protein
MRWPREDLEVIESGLTEYHNLCAVGPPREPEVQP